MFLLLVIVWSSFLSFFKTSIGLSNVISLEVFDVHPPKKLIYHFCMVKVLSSEFIVLHLPEMHDETR